MAHTVHMKSEGLENFEVFMWWSSELPIIFCIIPIPGWPKRSCQVLKSPSAQVYSHSSPNLSLGLHLAPSTATSHPAPTLHNQGKHKYTTIVNHSLQQHWSSLSLSFAQFILHYLIFFSIAREFCSTFKLRVCQTWKTGEYIFSEKNELEENHSKFQNEKMVCDTPASTLQDSIILISSCIQ